VEPGQQPGKLVPFGGTVAFREAGEGHLDGFAIHVPERSRPGAARGRLIREGFRAGVEQLGEASYGGGFRWDQRRSSDLGLVEEELDDATPGTLPRKDDGGGAEVGHGPLDIVLDEVSRGCGQGRVVPAEEHAVDGGGQG